MNRRDLDRLRAVRLAAASGRARQIRIDAGLSQGEVAPAIGVSQATLALWESNKRAPRGTAALRYADVLDELAKAPSHQVGIAQ